MAATEIVASFALGLISGAGATIAADWFNDYRKRLKMRVDLLSQIITKTPIKYSTVLGFGISLEQGKELNGAYVRCNGKRYPWYENGSPKEKTQLLVGEEPSWFFPYSITFDYVDDLSKQSNTNIPSILKSEKRSNHGVLFTVKELNTNNIVFSTYYAMPKNTLAFKLEMKQKIFNVSIKLIGEGIERKMNFEGTMFFTVLNIGKLDNGVPSLDTSDSTFVLYH